ncbi:MAG: GNAT family N-acetyltransferase [Myxococcota bacterium]
MSHGNPSLAPASSKELERLDAAHVEAERREAERTLREAPRALREAPGAATHVDWIAGRPRVLDALRCLGELAADVSGAVFRDPEATEAGWSPGAELAAFQAGDYAEALLLGGPLPDPATEAPPFAALPAKAAAGPSAGAAAVRALGEDDDPEAMLDAIVALEARVYEPARRDPREKLALAFQDPAGVVVLAETQGRLVGSALLAPLERVHALAGADDDPQRGQRNTAYTLAVTVDPGARGQGLGRRLKSAAVEAAARLKRPDGRPRYAHVSGRNRIGHTLAMRRINGALGAYELARYEGQYGGEGVAAYYRMPVRGYAPRATPPLRADWTFGEGRLLASPPASWRLRYLSGALAGAVANRARWGRSFLSAGAARAAAYLRAQGPLPDASLACAGDEDAGRAYLRAAGHDASVPLRSLHREAEGVSLPAARPGDALLLDLGPAAGVPLVAALHRGAPAHDAAPAFDALALERAHHVLREAAGRDREALGVSLALALVPFGAERRGAWLRVEGAVSLAAELGEPLDAEGRLVLAPPLDAVPEELACVREAVATRREGDGG